MALEERAGEADNDVADIVAPPLRFAPRMASEFDRRQLAGALRKMTPGQGALLILSAAGLTCAGLAWPSLVWPGLQWAGLALFSLVSMVRLSSAMTADQLGDAPALSDRDLPIYTLLLPLYREAAVLPDLIAGLAQLDYPPDKLQALVLLEADDLETQQAAKAITLPSFCEIFITPPGSPRTKPRACNLALERARGELLVIYDAEDRPDPAQLREAAARFASGLHDLACLQAPLRIERARGFLARQFALEYAVQFELRLPALAALGAPFPLGGTSNHFRTEVLRDLGGWDPFNVTEDADLGFRLAAAGWRGGMLSRPTWETAPESLAAWLPQRTRWLKGHLQTVGVHTRNWRAGITLAGSMAGTLGVEFACAIANGPICALLAALALVDISDHSFRPPVTALTLLFAGWAVNTACTVVALDRAGLAVRLRDLLLAPLYWPLQSLAMLHAVWRLFREPWKWDKTPHDARAPQAGRAASAPVSPTDDLAQACLQPVASGRRSLA